MARWTRIVVCVGFLFCVAMAKAKDLSKGFPMPPDTRPRNCPKYTKKDFANTTVSIIIPWLAEAWEHMEGTMKALLHMTPDMLVKEYIWISDGNADSKEKELKAMSDKVKVYAFKERQGLMLAKIKGVELATAPVLVFMEAHVIPNKHWLQHILRRVVQDPKVLSMPTIDHIDERNWHSYSRQPPGHWRYEWNFNLIYTNPEQFTQEHTEPYTSPGTSGGIFAMRRDWFDSLGLFDRGMREWGGDHMELTMKVWRCGGSIEIVPCSRVGHLYRTPQMRPYDVEVNTVVHNYKRLAELWAMDHLKYFYAMKPEARSMKLQGMDVVKANYEKLQREFQCKDMQWYLDTIDHEMKWEMTRICHPFDTRGGAKMCKGGQRNLIPGRWTVTETMPKSEYVVAKREGDARLAKERAELAAAREEL